MVKTEEEPSMTQKKVAELLERYPKYEIVNVNERLSQKDFDDQKEKQTLSPIHGGAIGVITTADGRVVLTHRTKPHGGWALPGGRVEHGEEFDQAFIREAEEECGIRVKVEGLVSFEDKHFLSPRGEIITFYLAVFRATTADVPYQTEEATKEGLEIAVFPLSGLPENMVLKDKEKIESVLA